MSHSRIYNAFLVLIGIVLGILRLTFGISVDLTLATVIFIILSLLIGRAIAR